MSNLASFPKTAILSLVWLVLSQLMIPSMFYAVKERDDEVNLILYVFEIVLSITFYLSLPVAGLYADMKFGRYKTAMFDLVLASLMTCLVVVMSVVVDKFKEANLIINIALPIITLSQQAYFIVNLLLGSDQLVTATSKQLSIYVWYFMWSRSLGFLLTALTSCLMQSDTRYDIYIICCHFVCLQIIIISGLTLKRYFIEYVPSRNPLKLIYNVLIFAKKNKYPVQRSALTYWEEIHPSRIDLGKDKYGGPFLEEEVEDVKTLLRMLPLVAVITMISFPAIPFGRLATTKLTFEQCIFDSTDIIQYSVDILAIPFYQFIKKCFHYRITILKTIGFGLFMSTISNVGFVTLDLYISLQTENSNQTCALEGTLNVTNQNEYLQHSTYIILAPNFIGAFGTILIFTGGLEFVFAQAPHSMKGLLIGVYFGLSGLYLSTGWMLINVFKYHNKGVIPSCDFYIFSVNATVMLTSLLLFLMLSKKYKLRSRGDIFNPNVIAENYYENDFLRRQMYENYQTF